MDDSLMPSRKPSLSSRSTPYHSHLLPQTTSMMMMSTRSATSPPSKVKCTLRNLREIYPNKTVLGNQINYAKLFQHPNGIPVTKYHLLDNTIPKDVWDQIWTMESVVFPPIRLKRSSNSRTIVDRNQSFKCITSAPNYPFASITALSAPTENQVKLRVLQYG